MVYKACSDRSGCRGEGGVYGLPFLSQAFLIRMVYHSSYHQRQYPIF